MSPSAPTIRQQYEGKKLRIFGGVEFIVKVASEENGGSFTLLENLNPAGTYLPPHVHAREDETFYILEGEFEFQIDDRVVRVGPGATVYAPRSIPHAFKVLDSAPGRLVLLATPGGFEQCMEELSALPMDPPDMARVFEICGRHGIEFLPSAHGGRRAPDEGGPMNPLMGADADRAAIDRVREAHIAALNGGNVEGWVALFAPDGVQMPPNAPANTGREKIRAWCQAFMAPFRVEFSLGVEEVQIAGDWAFERGAYRIALHPGVGGAIQDDGKYITVYERQAGGAWVVARDIWNSSNPPRQS